MPRKGENIFKRKDGRWEGRYIKAHTPQGKALYGYVYARTYKDIKQKLCVAIACQSGPASQPVLLTVTAKFREYANEWLAYILPQIKESSGKKYANLIASYVVPEIGSISICDVTKEFLVERCNDLLSNGGREHTGLSPKTVSDVLSVIRWILAFARSKGIQTQCTGRELAIKQSPKEMQILSLSDQERLYRYLVEHPSPRNLGILLSLFTGLRIGEVCALRWGDISLRERTLHVHQTMQRIQVDGEKKTAIVVTTPKSPCSNRLIPIPASVMVVIEQSFPTRQGYVLTGSNVKSVEPRTMQNYFKRILKVNDIEPVNFHALRHTFATRCVEVGFDVKSLSEILGHANVNITMNRYVHPTMKLKEANMQRLSELFLVR